MPPKENILSKPANSRISLLGFNVVEKVRGVLGLNGKNSQGEIFAGMFSNLRNRFSSLLGAEK